jgi:hypothetical protein
LAYLAVYSGAKGTSMNAGARTMVDGRGWMVDVDGEWWTDRMFLTAHRSRSTLFLAGWLKGPSLAVVKGFVEQEQVLHPEAYLAQLAAELTERIRPEAPADQAAEMFGTQVDGDSRVRLQREAVETNGTQLVADGTAFLFGLLDNGWTFPQSKHFLTRRAIRLACNAIPAALAPAAATTRERMFNAVGGHDAQRIHAWSPRRTCTLVNRTTDSDLCFRIADGPVLNLFACSMVDSLVASDGRELPRLRR